MALYNSYLILSSCYNKYGANSLCVRNIVEEIRKRGNKVTVLSELESGFKEYDLEDDVEVYRIPPTLHDSLSKNHEGFFKGLLFKINAMVRLVVAVPFFPNVAPLQSLKWCRKAQKLIEKNKVDYVVCFYRSYSSIKAGMFLKKKYGSSLKVVTFHLDLLSGISNRNPLAIVLKRRGFRKAFKKEREIIDKIIVPENAKKECEPDDKIAFCGFPVYKEEPLKYEKFLGFSADCINIAYVGTLDSVNRSPVAIIKLIEEMPLINGRRVILHFWGAVTDVSTLRMLEESSVVQYHGVVDNSKVWGILQASDFLLNISNMVTYTMLPSKTFQLISANKPIINLVQHKNDCALPYYKKAASILNIRTYENDDFTAVFKDFLKTEYGKKVYNNSELFKSCTPQYAVDLLESF